ncbi:MAG: 2-oxoacid:ferredoxin oxidoreductase subunit gamma [Methanobacteriaceae archaeon]|nr:2-oxoacid:ferredoxin oxidoreductase subunit gamma [Methanobacteriaceae archaeon]
MKEDIRVAGLGGQGVIMLGIVLGKAASLYADFNAVQTQSYGPEARGGASRAEVIISDEEIDYPKVENPDIFTSMSHEALMKYISDIKQGAYLIVDSGMIDETEIQDIIKEKNLKYYTTPATQTAEEKLGTKIVANIVMLGSLIKATNIIPVEAVKQAIKDSVPNGTEDKNIQAFQEGMNIVQKKI